ncbi:BTAD domain-containing putative transcriptional regulator [Actinomadura sp. SCN-SB]|uniref:BTAD domain-containing putative transcriptional regulator n=1 Tax=Actinomadura sp. SCN-SB TaxID=3373092 RepID=UPI00375239F3
MLDVGFSLLGPVEVRRDGRPVPLGGGRQRALLAALLLNADHVISIDRLVDELWGDLPPASARTQVHTLVHRVRRSLGAAGALIETTPPGYVLRTGRPGTSVALDVPEFTGRVGRARDRAAQGRPDEAVAEFRAALALWRGQPLEGASAAFVPREAARLDELRLTAIEECLGLELALGRHAAVVAELAALVDEHPLREELRARLMLALYRCGRRTEALEVYRSGRALLVEETGLEPTARLRELHEVILRGDRDPEPLIPVPERPRESPPTGTSAPAASAAGPAGSRRVRAIGVAVAMALMVCAGGSAAAGGFTTGASAQAPPVQFVPGPAWRESPPKPVPASFFGTTIGTKSGAMPGFRIGAARFWDSRTRWANVQPEPGRFDWSNLDRMVAGAERKRLPMLYTMGITPSWAAAPDAPRSAYDDGSRTAPPRDLSDWDEYVRAVVSRYKGRIGAYEIWDFANTPEHYTGDLTTLVEMTHRAAAIIKEEDPRATVVCPSFGELWTSQGRRSLAAFATLGGYRSCDAAAVKLHPRRNTGRPEEMTELAVLIYNTLHNAGVHLPMYATGPGHSVPTEKPLRERDANNYAVRFYLAGLYARYTRMYFYSWGVQGLPLVLQVEGSAPTRAALFIDRLQDWLDGASVRSCGQGRANGLPDGVWECRFTVPRTRGGGEAAVRWTAEGAAAMTLERGARRVDHLDGRSVPVRSGRPVVIGERPVLIRFG